MLTPESGSLLRPNQTREDDTETDDDGSQKAWFDFHIPEGGKCYLSSF